MPRATENIEEQINLIKKLEEKGFTYKTSDGIYFNTSKLSDYGKLAKLDIENLEEGSRVEKNPEKKNLTDFALWKFSEAPGKRQMEWESPWGLGFPGWHLECSAMATKFLGQPFEIHTGGVDHIPVHHTNEIAQSEAAYDKPLAKYWVHSDFILENGRKMAKSAGHFIRLQDLEDKGYSPLDFRYLCLTASYRSKLDFSWQSLDGAKEARRKIVAAYNNADSEGVDLAPFDEAISDDLDTARALAFIFKNLGALSQDNFEKIDKVLAILEKKEFKTEQGIITEGYVPQEVFKLALDRQKARQEKNWAKSDELREKIYARGFLIQDSDKGTYLLPK
jgi:cysteinyl-tRNA synthetase